MIIQAIGLRSGKPIVTMDYSPDLPSQNLFKLQKEIKKYPISNEQLFKKFPLRSFHYIDSKNNATMKSILKYTEINRLSLKIVNNEVVFQDRVTDECLIENTMYMMNMFTQFLELMKKSVTFADIKDKLNAQIYLKKKLTNDLYAIGKEILKIIKSDKPPNIKIQRIKQLLESFKTEEEEKKQVVEYLTSFIVESIASLSSQPEETIITYDEIIDALSDNFTESIDTINRILANLRMVRYNEDLDKENINMCMELLTVVDTYFQNKLSAIYTNNSFMINMYRLLKTISIGMKDNNLGDIIRSVIQDVKNQFHVSLNQGAVSFTRKHDHHRIQFPDIINFFEKVLIHKQTDNLSIDSLINEVMNGEFIRPHKELFYKQLEEQNILWSDDYLKTFVGTVIKLIK